MTDLSTSSVSIYDWRRSVDTTGTTTSNPITSESSSGVIDFSSTGSSSSGEQISLKSYFGTSTTSYSNTRYLAHSPYDSITYSKEEIDEVVTMMKSQAAQHGKNFDELSEEEKIRYTGLALALKSGRISEAEFFALISDSVSDDAKVKIQTYLEEHTSEIDEEKLSRIRFIMDSAAKKEAFVTFVAAHNIRGKNPEDTKTRRERFLLQSANQTVKTHQRLMQAVSDALPETCTQEVATKVIEATAAYAKAKTDCILQHARNNNYSGNLIEALVTVVAEVSEEIPNLTNKFLEGFFQTAKGKAIKRYIARNYKEIKEKKEECEAQKEELKKLEQQAQEAKAKSEEMLEKALEKKKRAEAVLEERGIKDVDPANIPKLLGKISVKEKLEYEYSVGKARIAEEQAEDAASKQRLAEAFYEIDKKSLEFEMKKFALKMAALFNLC